MRIFHELVVDDFTENPAAFLGSKPVWIPVVGNFETLRFFIVVDRVSGTLPTLSLSMSETPDPGGDELGVFPLLTAVSLTPGQPSVFTASVTDSVPCSYGYHFYWTLGGTAPKAHVRVWVTGRGKA